MICGTWWYRDRAHSPLKMFQMSSLLLEVMLSENHTYSVRHGNFNFMHVHELGP